MEVTNILTKKEKKLFRKIEKRYSLNFKESYYLVNNIRIAVFYVYEDITKRKNVFYLNFEDIIFAIKNNIEFEVFFKWINYNGEKNFDNKKIVSHINYINLKNFINNGSNRQN